MELSCPSCGTKHRTQDHPGAFEIQCVCGYSILVPDEAALAVPVALDEGPNFKVATAMDAEDAALAVPPPETPAEDTLMPGIPPPIDLTPPENLPSGMVYDPFELPATGVEPPAPELPPSEFAPSETQSSLEAPSSPSFEDAPPVAVEAPATKTAPVAPTAGQALVDRVQAASMGRLVGHPYRLKPKNLSRDALVEITRRCVRQVKARPWLETELRNRGVELDHLPDSPELNDVPELIALEIYLACFELGGGCDIERMG